MQEFKTLEEVALLLLKNRIEFNYSHDFVEVKDSSIKMRTATYHVDTRKVILMTGDYILVKHLDLRNVLTFQK